MSILWPHSCPEKGSRILGGWWLFPSILRTKILSMYDVSYIWYIHTHGPMAMAAPSRVELLLLSLHTTRMYNNESAYIDQQPPNCGWWGPSINLNTTHPLNLWQSLTRHCALAWEPQPPPKNGQPLHQVAQPLQPLHLVASPRLFQAGLCVIAYLSANWSLSCSVSWPWEP